MRYEHITRYQIGLLVYFYHYKSLTLTFDNYFFSRHIHAQLQYKQGLPAIIETVIPL